jgi:hypothetical protein
MGDTGQGWRGRLSDRVPPAGRLWLAVGMTCVSVGLLGGVAVLVMFGTLFEESCGEDWRWAALVAATAVATLAALVGLAVGGLSLHPAADGRGDQRWVTAILVVTVVAWSIAVVAPWLPSGACS